MTGQRGTTTRRWLERLDRLAHHWRKHATVYYALFAMSCTLYAAASFYGYMLVQTGGVWSAPLDDVFIHFDYARSFARGFPFHWSEGNGYSSGNTSLSYPIVLGLGYWLGFRKLLLMAWAAMVATTSIVAFLYWCGRIPLHEHAGGGGETPPQWIRFLIPPAVLSLGALDWTLFSGMENAFHLGIWGACLGATLAQTNAQARRGAIWRAWFLGLLGALLISARPESAVCVAAFGFYAAWHGHVRGVTRGWRQVLHVLVAVGSPGVLLLLVHGAANLALTGEWSANGAIAKLFLNNPFMTASDKWDRYLSLLGYIIPRLTHHHFAAVVPFGWLVPIMALVPLATRRHRPIALMLWAQIISWMLVVALNNQVRWHNERYAMPAVAWLLVLAALGVGVMMMRAPRSARPTLLASSYPYRVAAAIGIVALYWNMQAPRMQDQIWFFARASRNILDQHITAGLVLKRMRVKRVLVGDAGALMYASDKPGLDIIGLGGFRDYPFARSTVQGLGASIELIERIPTKDRPDVMAIYPSWWGDLPTYFGHYLTAVPVRGNVICGGAEKVLYRADWRALDRDGRPRSLRAGEEIVDELDVADLLSERNHRYNFPQPKMGFIRYRVLSDLTKESSNRDLFDAGRIIPGGQTERATLQAPPGPSRLILRVAPEREHRVVVTVDGSELGELEAKPGVGAWQELSLALPDGAKGSFELGLRPKSGEAVHYHLWVVTTAPQKEAP